jgi:hypothetical protein
MSQLTEVAKLRERVVAFLEQQAWVPRRETNGLIFYYPPDNLGIKGKFSLAVPIEGRSGAIKALEASADMLAQLYGFARVGDLLSRMTSTVELAQPVRLSARFIDLSTSNDTLPLASLAGYATNMCQGLYRGAKFKLGIESKENQLLAQQFVNECKFLQTERGSFITSVEVPAYLLKQSDLFGGEELTSAQVCSSIFLGLQFISQRILNDDLPFDSEEILGDTISLFDVELLESISEVVISPEIETIEFGLQAGGSARKISTGKLTGSKKERLRDYCAFVKKLMRGESDMDVKGTIVELRSRDPEGNKNYIRVVADFYGDRTFISAALSNEQYQLAVEAHRKKQFVRLVGHGMRLKTQIRMTELKDFEID